VHFRLVNKGDAMHAARRSIAGSTVFALMSCAQLALAQDPAPTPSSPQAPAALQHSNPLGAKPVDALVLGARRGGTQVFNQMALRGVVSDNQAIDVQTGNNLITDGALSGAAGLPMVIQNSGNNVLIQNATIVNLQMK
jgi:hypothetical protein